MLVSHDGASWLPEVLAALSAQTRAPDHLVAVDTGSHDGSPQLIAAALGAPAVISCPRATTFAAAVRIGIEAGSAAADRPDAADGTADWLWLLHDDCAPEPTALHELLARVEGSPSVWLVGPKVHSWDDSRLLEVGISIDLAGRVDTGLDGLELDQGQRDDVDDVLAVGTAGALVRRDVWERLGGLETGWAAHGDDADFGWRVNAAGGRVVVAPRAVVRHAAALSARRRHADVPRRHLDVVHRRHGMQVVLANTAGWLVPVLIVRYLLAALPRALALLLVRRPAAARVELQAVAGVLGQLGWLRVARTRRREHRSVRHRELRHLFPPRGRWRYSMARLGFAGSGRAGVTARPSRSTYETGPVAEESESLAPDDSAIERFLRRPGVLLFLATTLLALVAERHVLSATVHGGRLLPAPAGADSLWSAYLSSWHAAGVGSTAPAPPSLAVLALLSTVAFGKVWLAVDVILLGAVPLAAASAYLALRPFCPGVTVRIWAAVTYSVLPPVTGAIAGGRLDVAIAAILLPVTARAVAAAVRGDPRHGGWHHCAGAGLLLAVVAAVAPVLWLTAVAVVLAVVALQRGAGGDGRSSARRLAAAGMVLAVVPIVLFPWLPQLVRHPALLVSGSGLPDPTASRQPPSGLSLLLLHAGGPAQPVTWIVAPLVLAALLGLLSSRRRTVARSGAALLIVGLAAAIAVTRLAGVRSGFPDTRWWPGAVLAVAGAGMLLSATVAATGLRPTLRRQSFGWRQPAVAVLGLASIAATGVLAIGWLARGAQGPLTGSSVSRIPVYVQAELTQPGRVRALVLQAHGPTVDYEMVRRSSGPQLGDADVGPVRRRGSSAAASTRLTSAVSDLVAGNPGAGSELVPFAVSYIVVPAHSRPQLGSALAKVSTLSVVPVAGATVYHSSLPAGELTVTSPGHAGRRVLPVTSPVASVTLGPGAPGRLAVLAEPADGHWRATLNGHALPAQRVDGWSQGWRLPAGGGLLRVSFHDPGRGVLLALQLALLVVVALLAVPARRREQPGIIR